LPDEFPAGDWLLLKAERLGVGKTKPAHLISGRELIDMGFTQGNHIGEIIRLADDLRDGKGMTRDEVLSFFTNQDAHEVIEELKKLE
jgi:hypothetical protein